MNLTIEIDDAKIMAALQRLIDAGSDTTPAMRAIAGVFREATQQAFDSESDPATGKAWSDLKEATKKRRAQQGKWPGKKLQVDGHLANIQTDYGADFAIAFSPEKYAATQHFGDWGRNIHARPFFGLSENDKTEIIDILRDHLAAALR